MNPIFKDIEHEQFYEGNLRMTNSQNGPYRQAFFYVLGVTPQTRQHIYDLYDYENKRSVWKHWNKAGRTAHL